MPGSTEYIFLGLQDFNKKENELTTYPEKWLYLEQRYITDMMNDWDIANAKREACEEARTEGRAKGLAEGKKLCREMLKIKKLIFILLFMLFVSCSKDNIPTDGTAEVPTGAVDLGLSVFWAACNIGASRPEDYGGYYQWAGLEDVTDTNIRLDWDNCPYHNGSREGTGWIKYVASGESVYWWSGYGSPDNKEVLDSEDDVASVRLGGKWRMPTELEWKELRNTCSWTWVEQNGVKGYEVTSREPIHSGKSIFLPVAGYRYYGELGEIDVSGAYWSSSLETSSPGIAAFLGFDSCDVFSSAFCRYYGLSVRPVFEK